MKEWALITGASAGIGHELARVFAERNFNLALTARNEARLNQIAEELRSAFKTEVLVIPKDLVRPETPAEIFTALGQTRMALK